MIVETYEVTELTTEGRDPVEIEAEALELIESLGLEGQQSLVHEDPDEGEPSRIPYRLMTTEEARVYSTNFPSRTPIEEYRSEPIPLRVLQVAAHARPLFDALEVWHPEEFVADPVLVGRTGERFGRATFHLLARWGDSLRDFEDLKDAAVEKIAEAWRVLALAKQAELASFTQDEAFTQNAKVRAFLVGKVQTYELPFSYSTSV